MADIRQKIVKNATPHLQPGETSVVAFTSQTKPAWWLAGVLFVFTVVYFALGSSVGLLAGLGLLVGIGSYLAVNRYRPVVVTDRRIIVFDSGALVTTQARSIVRETPRNIAMGPASGLWYTMTALGEPLIVHKRFHKDIAAADASIASQLRPPTG